MAADARKDKGKQRAGVRFDIDDDEDEEDAAFVLAMAEEASKLSQQYRKQEGDVKAEEGDEQQDSDRLRFYLTGKRKHGSSPNDEERERGWDIEKGVFGPDPLLEGTYDVADSAEDPTAQRHRDKQAYMASEAYKSNTFGDFRSYMQNKRLKLKVQELSMGEDHDAAVAIDASGLARPKIYPVLFPGTNIYINGHTIPPYAELRRLIHLHGGELMPYLDTKSPVTHIIASNLTAKKRIEFAAYKVVRPEWITASIAQGRRLDWRDFRCNEDASGTMQMGALAARVKVGGAAETPAEQEARKRREIEEVRALAARSLDWRTAAASDAAKGVTGVQPLRSYAHSGTGVGGNGGVGPWGMASRQQTLGGWAERKGTPTVKEDATGATNDRPAEKASPPRGQTAALPPSVQVTAEDEPWEDEMDIDLSGIDDSVFGFETSRAMSNAAQNQESTVKNEDSNVPAIARVNTDPMPAKEQAAAPITPTRVRQAEVDARVYTSIGTDPPTEAAAVAAGMRKASHPYALRPSNSKAAQLMASPSWRERNTATYDGFLQGYFSKSRLHHLSTWKSEMREMVGQALREANREQGSIDLPRGLHRVIFHVDFDAFFVSVGLRTRPDLHGKAAVVCHATDADMAGDGSHSTSEIASCNYTARTHGIRNGMSLGQARRMCPSVATVPYDFTAYNDIAVRFYTLLLSHADAIEAVSIDEALIDVSFLLDEMRRGGGDDGDDDEGAGEGAIKARQALMTAYQGHMGSQGKQWSEEKQLAEALRDEIRKTTGCEASIGIGSNVLLARLATRKAKPGGSYHLRDEDVAAHVDELNVDDLHGVGWSIRNRCRELFGTSNVGEVKAVASRSKFVAHFGDKHGSTIWDKLHGIERDRLESVKARQSCGTSINYAIRFKTDDEAKEFVRRLSHEVSSRLKAISMAGRQCCVSLMVRSKDAPVEAPKFLGHGICDTYNRSTALARLTDDGDAIFATAWKLIAALRIPPSEMRGVGVSLQKLEANDGSTRVQREAGQSVLSFGKAVQIMEPPRKSYSADDGQEQGGESGELEQHRAIPLPPATQFIIPPASQLDPSVVAALPEFIRKQIASGQPKARSEDVISVTNDDSPRKAPSEATPSSSTMTTPTKPRSHKLVDPFERMRAASITPTKKKAAAIKASTSSAPSTPSGSQRSRGERRAAATSTWQPNWSQIDFNVLSELPESVREEIMRQMGGRSGVGSAASSQADVSAAGVRRSQSESPRKKQAHLDISGQHDGGGGGQAKDASVKTTAAALAVMHAPLPPLIPKRGGFDGRRIDTANAVVVHLNPLTVTRQELLQLEIDPDVFAALPASLKQDTLDEQSRIVADRKARFKTGRHTDDMTRAQQRLLHRKNALDEEHGEARNMSSGGGANLRAMTQSDTTRPTIKGMHSEEDVCGLITQWVHQFARSGPRKRDVERFARFLVGCIEGVDGDDAADGKSKVRRSTRKRTGAAGHAPSPQPHSVPPTNGLEIVHGVLQWWRRALKQLENGGATAAKNESIRDWWAALNGVHEQLNAITRKRYGATLAVRM